MPWWIEWLICVLWRGHDWEEKVWHFGMQPGFQFCKNCGVDREVSNDGDE